MTLRLRAKELQYNTKIDIYQQTQESLRKLDKYYRELQDKDKPTKRKFKQLDLEVVTVKPDTLCKTFAFHPMLGFKRQSQKESIAHGCAGTLLRFGEIKNDTNKTDYLSGWRINKDNVPDSDKWADAFDKAAGDIDWLKKEGRCWLTKRKCPYAKKHLEALIEEMDDDTKAKETLHEKTLEEVNDIHETCLIPETHLRDI